MAITLTREQVRRVDELAIHRYGISGLVLMENAGRNAASIIEGVYGPSRCAVIFCGSGNNGGDGCVIARHLHKAGWSVRVVLVGEAARMTPDALVNYRIIEAMGLKSIVAVGPDEHQAAVSSITEQDIVVDALLGTGFTGEVRSPLADVIHAINAARKRGVVAVDLPSGLDCNTGKPCKATIRADRTITFVARKIGFDAPDAVPYVGRIEVADIGAPHELIVEVAEGCS